jgi:hypothetical protein
LKCRYGSQLRLANTGQLFGTTADVRRKPHEGCRRPQAENRTEIRWQDLSFDRRICAGVTAKELRTWLVV